MPAKYYSSIWHGTSVYSNNVESDSWRQWIKTPDLFPISVANFWSKERKNLFFLLVYLFSSNRQIPVILSRAVQNCQTYSKDVLGIKASWSMVSVDKTLIKTSSSIPWILSPPRLAQDWSPLTNSYVWPWPELKHYKYCYEASQCSTIS